MSRLNLIFVLYPLALTIVDAADNQNSCWSSSTIYRIASFNDVNANSIIRNVNYTEFELVNECHLSFVQKLANKTCLTSTRSSRKPPPLAHRYGYGFLAVFIISILSLAGFLAFPLMKKPYYKYFNAFFTALAVGTLFSDAAFELLPVIIQSDRKSSHLHEHGVARSEQHSNEIRISPFLWQMATVVLTAYVFYIIELIIHAFMLHRHQHKETEFDLGNKEVSSSEPSVLPNKTLTHLARNNSIVSTNTVPNLTVVPGERQTKSTGWMIIIGDGIHNVADGLAIGAAFAENTIFGVTTAVAIACHELPTELGEYMVLIESGFTFRRALLFNFISACTAIIGFFIGASVAQDESARVWIFAITAGTFAYIALVDLWPTLMPETDRFNWIRFTCVTCGYLSGVFIMFILSMFEERIVQSSVE
ncbi:unnamed protein product [Adineta ricciae]|uniref:Uncharacterized protein n=1 Tax=Adineta ricciae TaxID=249248 RepID=A0A814T810_ADIRI|nr:unnamed protein product [Adineta ricciae]